MSLEFLKWVADTARMALDNNPHRFTYSEFRTAREFLDARFADDLAVISAFGAGSEYLLKVACLSRAELETARVGNHAGFALWADVVLHYRDTRDAAFREASR